jgi:hypothetical protein
MLKKVALAGLAVFVAWSLLDMVIHGVILKSAYESSSHLWRPMAEMKMNLIHVVVLIAAFVFVSIYGWFVTEKSPGAALKYGILYGFGAGVSMGYGSYAVIPMPYHIALVWFLGTLVEFALAGWLLGLIIKPSTGSVPE